MAKQRDQIQMTPEEVDTFLRRQRSASVATLGPQGQVHLVAMWFAYLDGEIWIETKAKSQKVVNLRRDDTMSVLVEAGRTYDQLRGVALEGRGEVVEDPEALWRVGVDVFERYQAPYTEAARPLVETMLAKRVAVRLVVDRTRSWDHRKLGMDRVELGGSTAPFVE